MRTIGKYDDLIPYNIYLSPNQLKKFRIINTIGFNFQLSKKSHKLKPNMVVPILREDIKKVEKAKAKGVGVRLRVSAFDLHHKSKKEVNKNFSTFLERNNLTYQEYLNHLRTKRGS